MTQRTPSWRKKLSQVKGVGQVFVWGSSSPAVRVEANPQLLNSYGISLETVRKALQNANSNQAKGSIASADRAWALSDTDQLFKAYRIRTVNRRWTRGWGHASG